MAGELQLGSTLGAYRLRSVLGRGGMGIVYEAEHTVLGKIVAVKVVAPDLAHEPAFVERFLREARIAASLEHPAILPVHDAGEAEGVVFFAMPRVLGMDLGHLLGRSGPLGRDDALAVLTPVAGALDAAHQRNLVHRDVKPGNVLVELPELGGHGRQVYLMDFGLGKQLDRRTQLSQAGTFTGTFAYAAPEQFAGRAVDGRTDQYALACVLFECLTGTPPFVAETEAQLMYAHLQSDPPSLSARMPGPLPPEMDMVLARALAKDREARYPRCAEFVEAFRAASGPRDVTVPAPPPLRPKPEPPPAPATRIPTPAPERPRTWDAPAGGAPSAEGLTGLIRRRTDVPWALLVLVLAGLGTALSIFTIQSASEARRFGSGEAVTW